MAALLVASFAAIAGLISLDIPAVAALVGLLPIAIVRVARELDPVVAAARCRPRARPMSIRRRHRREAGTSPLPRSRRTVAPRTVLVVSSLGVFMAFVDNTIVSIAFPNMRASFPSASLASLSWVFNAYNIAIAALLVPAGRFADLRGPAADVRRGGGRLHGSLGALRGSPLRRCPRGRSRAAGCRSGDHHPGVAWLDPRGVSRSPPQPSSRDVDGCRRSCRRDRALHRRPLGRAVGLAPRLPDQPAGRRGRLAAREPAAGGEPRGGEADPARHGRSVASRHRDRDRLPRDHPVRHVGLARLGDGLRPPRVRRGRSLVRAPLPFATVADRRPRAADDTAVLSQWPPHVDRERRDSSRSGWRTSCT